MADKNLIVYELDEVIDHYEEILDENGNIIYASRPIEEKFEEVGWDKKHARINGVRLVYLTEDLSKYATTTICSAWFAKNNVNGTSFLGIIDNSSSIHPIETFYDGYRFRSRLEARWAVFFDACKPYGLSWEYEPEGFDLGDGFLYLPDFLLHGVRGRACGDLWVEVKGKLTARDKEKIIRFSGIRFHEYRDLPLKNPIYIVNDIPQGNTFFDYVNNLDMYHKDTDVPFFNFELVDGDYYKAIPCITQNGFELCGPHYLFNVNESQTMKALLAARQARFEHGEHGYDWRKW